ARPAAGVLFTVVPAGMLGTDVVRGRRAHDRFDAAAEQVLEARQAIRRIDDALIELERLRYLEAAAEATLLSVALLAMLLLLGGLRRLELRARHADAEMVHRL